MKSNALFLVLLCLVLQSPAPAQEKPEGKGPSAPAAKRKFTDEEQKLLDEGEKQYGQAMALARQGKLAEAEKEFRAVLASYERVLGAEHPEVARCCMDLAMSLVAQKKYEEALAFIQKAESVWEERFGADSWFISEAKEVLERIEAEMKGVPFVAKRKFRDEEQKLLDQAGKQFEKAVVLDGQGKYAEAEKEYRAVSAIRERVLLADHPDTLKSRNHLARALQAQGKHAEAKKEFWAVLVLREHALGAEHPDVFQSCFNVALCLEAQKKFLEALVFIQRAERGWQKAFGADFSDTKKAKQARERIEEKMKAGK